MQTIFQLVEYNYDRIDNEYFEFGWGFAATLDELLRFVHRQVSEGDYRFWQLDDEPQEESGLVIREIALGMFATNACQGNPALMAVYNWRGERLSEDCRQRFSRL